MGRFPPQWLIQGEVTTAVHVCNSAWEMELFLLFFYLTSPRLRLRVRVRETIGVLSCGGLSSRNVKLLAKKAKLGPLEQVAQFSREGHSTDLFTEVSVIRGSVHSFQVPLPELSVTFRFKLHFKQDLQVQLYNL